MFKQILFDFDCNGNLYGKSVILSAEHVRAKCFQLCSVEHRMRRGTLPAIRIIRIYKNLETDPYNEDGSPPNVWTTIVQPHIVFMGNAIEITGFESPNMGFAGLVQPAYKMCKPLDLPEERIWKDTNNCPREFEDMPRQRIVLM